VTIDVTAALATLMGVAAVAIIGVGVWRQARERLPSEPPDGPARARAAEALWRLYPAFPDEEPETALFLLEESKRTYDGWIESNARIEAKATWLTGFLAGGAGLLTVFGGHGDHSGGPATGPFLWLAIIAAFGALLCALYVVRPKLRPHPEVSDYVSVPIALSPKARFHLALSLAEEYTRCIRTIARLRRFDALAWSGAQFCLVVGIVAILIHFGLHASDDSGQRAVVQCSGQDGAFRHGNAWKSRCEELDHGR
jgi:hypothetical protein